MSSSLASYSVQCSSQTRGFIRQHSKQLAAGSKVKCSQPTKALNSQGTINPIRHIMICEHLMPQKQCPFKRNCQFSVLRNSPLGQTPKSKARVWNDVKLSSLFKKRYRVVYDAKSSLMVSWLPAAQHTFFSATTCLRLCSLGTNVRECQKVWMYSECCDHLHPQNASMPINRQNRALSVNMFFCD